MGEKRKASEIQKLASELTKMNKGLKVKLADVREVLSCLVIMDAKHMQSDVSGPAPLDILIERSRRTTVKK